MNLLSRIGRQLSTPDALSALLFCAALVQALRQVHAAWPFVTDDAFVTLRYSKQLAAGAGLRFNADEAPVEGYSNLSYVLIGAATLHLPGGPLQALRALNVLSLCLSLSLTYVLARRHISPVLAAAPVWVLAVYKGTAWWTSSGLETAFAQALVTGAALQLDSLLACTAQGSQRRAFTWHCWNALLASTHATGRDIDRRSRCTVLRLLLVRRAALGKRSRSLAQLRA